MTSAPLTAVIDTRALVNNVQLLQERAVGKQLVAIVKADAYGHGVNLVVPALARAGVTHFGTATIPEAVAVQDILAGLSDQGDDGDQSSQSGHVEHTVMCWLYEPNADLSEPVKRGIELGVGSPAALESIFNAAHTTGKTARIHLKVDTGLGRNGLNSTQLQQVLEQLSTARGVQVCGVMSHFACADEPDNDFNKTQIEQFHQAVDTVKATLQIDSLMEHIANSPAILSMDPVPGNAVRAGVAMYGLSPFAPVDQSYSEGLQPAMTVVSHVCAAKDVPAGQGASYGLRYTTSAPSKFALVAGGYGDGIPRQASHKAHVAIQGKAFPIVGSIAMDQMIADVGDAQVSPGDPVVIWGNGGPHVDEWAQWAGTINYDIVTRLGARVPRVEQEHT